MENNDILRKYIPMTETGCYILHAIYKEPKCGYTIVQYVKAITENRITLGNGTLYGTLSKMEKDGLITVIQDDNKKKIYDITAIGQDVLLHETNRIKALHHILGG